jgi:ribosome hibernation promoting factor
VDIKIAARHGSLSPITQERISAKVEKLTRLFERLTEIVVAINLEKQDQIEVNLRVSAEHKHDFVSSETSGELMSALDGAMHKIEQQLRKYKDKIQKHHRGEGVQEEETLA